LWEQIVGAASAATIVTQLATGTFISLVARYAALYLGRQTSRPPALR
jgi:hypothetical protein